MAYKASGVSCIVSGNRLLTEVSLGIDPGECLAVIGPNGAGKSTLLRVLLGLVKYQGEISIDDFSIHQLSRLAIAKKAGYVPQRAFFSFPYSVKQFISMSNYLGYGTSDQAIQSLLTELGSEHLANHTLSELSGGELQKVLIASALAQNPSYLLLDEPATFLDPAQSQEFERLLKKLKGERKIGICVVTHDLAGVRRYADRVLGLVKGKTLFECQASELSGDRLKDIYGAVINA